MARQQPQFCINAFVQTCARILCVWGLTLLLAGCGGDDAAPATSNADNLTEHETQRPTSPITTAIGNPEALAKAKAEKEALAVESLLKEITFTRMKAFPETDDIDELREFRHQRNTKIIDLATQVIAKTHKVPDSQRQFSVAVTYLMTATKELALQGDRAQIDALYEHASALYQRDPKSKAAADAAYFVATFAYDNALRFGDREPRWMEEFARQSRLFATNFPHEDRRSVALLNSAAVSSELNQMPDEAKLCYSLICEQFGKSTIAKQATASLRRLDLQGKKLQLAGPTLDGGFATIDDYRGGVSLVVFWSTAAKAFRDELPDLLQLLTAKNRRIGVLGVNLDEDEEAVQSFLEEFPVQWPQIFHLEKERRGWKSPPAEYYGVRALPMYWLVSREGIVVEMTTTTRDLAAQIELLESLKPAQK